MALILVLIGIASAGYAAFCADRFGCAVLALLGVLWLWVNKPVEGVTLIRLSPTHGITSADLFSVAIWGLAIYGWLRARQKPQLP